MYEVYAILCTKSRERQGGRSTEREPNHLLSRAAVLPPLEQNVIYSAVGENQTVILRALAYFTYRYYLKAINEADPELNALLILFSVLAGVYLNQTGGITLKEAYRLYSKETEHDPERLKRLKDKLFELTA